MIEKGPFGKRAHIKRACYGLFGQRAHLPNRPFSKGPFAKRALHTKWPVWQTGPSHREKRLLPNGPPRKGPFGKRALSFAKRAHVEKGHATACLAKGPV